MSTNDPDKYAYAITLILIVATALLIMQLTGCATSEADSYPVLPIMEQGSPYVGFVPPINVVK